MSFQNKLLCYSHYDVQNSYLRAYLISSRADVAMIYSKTIDNGKQKCYIAFLWFECDTFKDCNVKMCVITVWSEIAIKYLRVGMLQDNLKYFLKLLLFCF